MLNIQRELKALLASGLRFSLEVRGREVRVWVGNYVRRATPDATFSSVEQAVEWLRHYRPSAAPVAS